MQEKILDYLNYWFTKTSPAHKFLDVFVLFIAALLAGVLWFGWKSQDELRELAIAAVRRNPELDRKYLHEHFEEFWKEAQINHCVRACFYEIDLSANTMQLVEYKVSRQGDSTLDVLTHGAKKSTFISQDMTPEMMRIASNMMNGDPLLAPSWINRKDDVLYVPVPDRPSAVLVGMITVAWDGDIPDNSPQVSAMRMAAHEFAEMAFK